ncbi:MAG: hypothetical protein KDB23_01870 [Planctomycetales bacterium]|nr:hypothetical protein [Planctomycetales bacterium]
MDEICMEVWDYLYKNGPTSVQVIAGALEQTPETIQQAGAHEWFVRQNDMLAIAVIAPTQSKVTRATDEESCRIIRRMFESGN